MRSDNKESATFKTIDNKIKVLETAQLESLKPADSSVHSICDDFAQLDELDEDIMLHHMRRRFERRVYYTNLHSVLIFVNPLVDRRTPQGRHAQISSLHSEREERSSAAHLPSCARLSR